jgi:hypothetical protein
LALNRFLIEPHVKDSRISTIEGKEFEDELQAGGPHNMLGYGVYFDMVGAANSHSVQRRFSSQNRNSCMKSFVLSLGSRTCCATMPRWLTCRHISRLEGRREICLNSWYHAPKRKYWKTRPRCERSSSTSGLFTSSL